jgi:hypothetical protein
MAIPENVKKQAMDAVNGKVTTAFIRLYSKNNEPAKIFSTTQGAEKTEPASRGVMSDAVKAQAMDAVTSNGTLGLIRSVEEKGSIPTIGASAPGSNPLAEKIAKMHQMGMSTDSVHDQITKDDFGRDDA